MSLLSRLLSRKVKGNHAGIQFGRYSDGYKTGDQLEFWNRAQVAFHQEKYLSSLENMLIYLKEPMQDNVHWTHSNGQLNFQLYQGSKVITGEASALRMMVTARIAGFDTPDISWMRLLLEENYSMTYSRFAINDRQEIIIVFDNYMEEALPQKLYEALRELAIRADKMDDLLLSEFHKLKPVENIHIIELPDHVIQAKVNYFRKKTEEVLQKTDHPTDEILRCKGSLVFMILACGYSLDYLIKPEGKLMKHIEACHRLYFNDPAETIEIKTSLLIRQFKEVLSIQESELVKEFYDIRSTFGQDLPIGSNGLLEVLDAQWNDLEWYLQNQYFDVHKYICDYVVGFAFFSMSLPEGYKALLHIYYIVTESAYFEKLEVDETLFNEEGFRKKRIIKKIQQIVSQSTQSDFPMVVDTSVLSFENLSWFRHSFLFMVKNSLSTGL